MVPPDLVKDWMRFYGSPLLVGSRSILTRRIDRLSELLPEVEWHYALKANRDPELLRIVAQRGWGFDIASATELDDALQAMASVAGVRVSGPRMPKAMSDSVDRHRSISSSVIHSHPCKNPRDISGCWERGVRRFVFDSVDELHKLATGAPKVSVLLRLFVPNRSGRVSLSSRFGAAMEEVLPLARLCRELNLSLEGIAFHVGSQATDPADFDVALRMARQAWDTLEEDGYELSLLDIGGGFPVPYRDQAIPRLDVYLRHLADSLKCCFAGTSARVVAEPGRVVCAEAIGLLTTVIGKARRDGTTWYTIDDGRYGSFSGRYFSERAFEFWVLPRGQRAIGHAATKGAESLAALGYLGEEATYEPCMIAGPTCDGGDLVAIDYRLPPLECGDILFVKNIGAYGQVNASSFNGMANAKTIWID